MAISRLHFCALEDRTAPSAGALDVSYGGGDGIVRFNLPSFGSISAIGGAVQSDAKSVIVGNANSGSGLHAMIARLNFDGTLDTSFSNDGFAASQFTGSMAHFDEVLIQDDGKIVAAGSVSISSNVMVLVARFNADGTLDDSFSDDGYATVDVSASDENGMSMALQSDGGIVVVGHSGNNFLFVRLTSDGTPDSTFSGDGILNLAPGGATAMGKSVVIQPDGKIVGFGWGTPTGAPSRGFMLLRLNSDGTPDNSFDGDGIVATTFPGSGYSEGYDLALLPDGRFVAVGAGEVSGIGKHSIARYLADGQLDTSFDGDGRTLFNFPGVGGGILEAVTVQDDSKIVAAGYGVLPNDSLIMRFNEDGSLDADFGAGGSTLVPGVIATNVSSSDRINDVIIQTDGRIFTAGDSDGFATSIRYFGDVLAAPDAYNSDEDTLLQVDAPGVLANDPYLDGPTRVVSLVDGPQHAANFTLNPDGSFSYLPELDYFGPDSFSYKFTAGLAESSTAVVSLTIEPETEPPTSLNDAYELPRILPLSLSVSAAQGVLANDSDAEGDTLHAILVAAPAVGTLDLHDDGSFTYDFPADLDGSVTFTYKPNDGTSDGPIATATLTRPANLAPIAQNDIYLLPLNSPLEVPAASGVLSSDTDGDGDVLSVILISGPSTGSLTLQSDGAFSYTYSPSFVGSVFFTYQATDGRDVSNIATVTLTSSNHPPVALDDSFAMPFTSPFTANAPGVLLNDADMDGDVLIPTLVSQPAVGTLTLNTDGSFSYAFPSDLVGPVSFTYKLFDGIEFGNTATVTLTRQSLVTLEAASYSAIEGGVTVEIKVARLGGTEGAITFDYSFTNGTASTSDYSVAPSAADNIGWLTGESDVKTFTFTVTPDDLSEGAETVNINLTNLNGAASFGTAAAVLTIVANDPLELNSTTRFARTFTVEGGDIVTVKLSPRTTGTADVFLTNGSEPISAVVLSGTDSEKSKLTLSIKKKAGDGVVSLKEVSGSGLKSLIGKRVNLDGAGINLGADYLGSLTLASIGGGADITAGGTNSQKTKIKVAGPIGDGSDIALGSILNSLSASGYEDTDPAIDITAPSIGNIKIRGNFWADIGVSGEGVDHAKKKSLNKLTVKGIVDDSQMFVTGNVGRVSVYDFLNSRLFAGYAAGQPDDGTGTFDLTTPSTISSFKTAKNRKLGLTGQFWNSSVIASVITKANLANVVTANFGDRFGIFADVSFRSITTTIDGVKTKTVKSADFTQQGDFDIEIV